MAEVSGADLYPTAQLVPAGEVRPGDVYLDSAGPAHVLNVRGVTAQRPTGRRMVGRRLTCRYVWETDFGCRWHVGPLDPDARVRIAQRER